MKAGVFCHYGYTQLWVIHRASPFLDDLSFKVISPFVLIPYSPTTFQPHIQSPQPRGENNILVTIKWLH